MAKNVQLSLLAGAGSVVLLATLLGGATILSAEPAKSIKPIRTFEVPANPVALAASPNGKFLAVASKWPYSEKPLGVWDITTGRKVVELNDKKNAFDGVNGVSFSPDGKLLAAVTVGGKPAVRLWDTTTWQIVKRFTGMDTRGGWSLAFSPDGKFLATGHSNRLKGGYVVYLWNVQTGKRIVSLAMGDGLLASLEFSHDGMYLMSRGSKTLCIWNTATTMQQEVKPETGRYLIAHFSPIENSLHALDNDGNLCVLKAPQWQETKREKLRDRVGLFKCLPNSPLLVMVTHKRMISSLVLFDPTNGRQVKTIVEHQCWRDRITWPLHNMLLSRIGSSSDGSTLFSVTYGTLSVWVLKPPGAKRSTPGQ